MADDFEYEVITDPDVAGFFTGPVDSLGNFLSEEIAVAAATARETELREIKHLRRVLDRRRRSGNIAASTYERGLAILDAQQDALERADRPAAVTMPEPLSPYNSAMMVARKPTAQEIRSKARWPHPTPKQRAKAAGLTYYRGLKRCKRGHDSLRAVASGGCLACMGIWESENRERVRAHWRESKRRTRAKAQAQSQN